LTFPVNLRFPGEVSRDFDSRYVRKENFDEEFLSRFFGGSDSGNLYRGMNPGGPGSDNADLEYLGENRMPTANFTRSARTAKRTTTRTS